MPKIGNLEGWAMQGVLLLNAILTVRADIPASHRNIGWEKLTDAAIKALSDKRERVVFLLWGKFAQEKEKLINTEKHFVLKSVHPSPYSANAGFFGCKHFPKPTNICPKLAKRRLIGRILNRKLTVDFVVVIRGVRGHGSHSGGSDVLFK